MRPSGAGLGNISGQECTFSYMYTCIRYKLPTFGEYMLVGGFVCREFINWYWIYSANIWGMYVIWRVSVRPSAQG